MANRYSNGGAAITAENMKDVTAISNHFFNAPTTRSNVSLIDPPTKISFKPIVEPHEAFSGRNESVNSAIKYLSHKTVPTNCQIKFPCMVIHALGGYGKTETARMIASRCRTESKFQHFIWIDSEDDGSIKKCFVERMNEIGLAASDESSANVYSLLHQFYDRLLSRKNEKFLIIFDNVEDFDNILNYLPLNYRASNIAVLMTSRYPFKQQSYGNVNNQQLGVLDEDEAFELVDKILCRFWMDSEQEKKQLVERSGRITLLLCVMTTTIKFQRKCQRNYRIMEYLAKICDEPAQYIDESKELGLNYDKSLQTIVRFAVDKLKSVGGPIGQIAVKIFDRLAYCLSTNKLTTDFVDWYLRDICGEAKIVDLKLPIKLTDDLQIIRLAIGKLSEFSLVQLGDDDEFSVHRWIQTSRRLDLKESGDERRVLKELLLTVPHMGYSYGNTVSIWKHAADCFDLVNEFYAKKRTFLEFPITDIDILEKILRELNPPTDPDQLEHFSNEINSVIRHYICVSTSIHDVKRIVNASNLDATKDSEYYLEKAIFKESLDLIKWLINEKACIPEVYHLRLCLQIAASKVLTPNRLKKLKELNVKLGEGTENNCEKNLFERIYTAALNKIRSLRLPWTSPCIEIQEINYILSALVDSDPFKIGLCEIIEKNYGKNVLDYLLRTETNVLTEDSMERTSECIKMFEIKTVVSGALVPHTKSSRILERYSGKSLLECVLICGHSHATVTQNAECEKLRELPAWYNDLAAIDSMDPTIIEYTTKSGMTPLIFAVQNDACEAATVLLEKHSANVNAMDNNGWTPLAYAIENQNLSMVEILLRHGAKTYWKTESGVTVHAIHNAVKSDRDYKTISSESEQIVDAVLASDDCDVCATDLDGNNILHLLVKHYYATNFEPNHLMLQVILLTNPTLVNMQNNGGLTPFQLAKNIQERFTDGHWHFENLQSFISELSKVCSNESFC